MRVSEPGGILAEAMLDQVAAAKPGAGGGLDAEYSSRLSRAVDASGQPGLLARVLLTRSLAYLEAIDPDWVAAKLIPHLAWDQAGAAALWRARAMDQIGSPRLFNAVAPATLEAFEHLSDRDLEGLIVQLLTLALAHRRREALEYNITSAEIKRVLTVAPPGLRGNASWHFWKMMGADDGIPIEKAARWREAIGPLLREIWPLDARLRDEHTSQNFVLMALECDEAFEEAVNAIIDFIVPYQLYRLGHSLLLEPHHAELVRRYPRAFLRLTNSLVDPSEFPVPDDLAQFLQTCVAADATVVTDPSFIRLFGLRRQQGA
jgi:hypothetical protein